MTDEELLEASADLTQNFIKAFSKQPRDRVVELAVLCMGRLLGTAYSTDVNQYGKEHARKFLEEVFMNATLCARMTGADPDFAMAVVNKIGEDGDADREEQK